MLAMAAANAVGVVLFATLYALAGARYLGQLGFLICLLVLFALVTALWVRVEARHRALEPVSRLGRVAVGLAIVILATPAVVLMPLFWLDTVVPEEAGVNAVLAPVMALVLISLFLVVVVNMIGGFIALGRGLLSSRARRASIR